MNTGRVGFALGSTVTIRSLNRSFLCYWVKMKAQQHSSRQFTVWRYAHVTGCKSVLQDRTICNNTWVQVALDHKIWKPEDSKLLMCDVDSLSFAFSNTPSELAGKISAAENPVKNPRSRGGRLDLKQ